MIRNLFSKSAAMAFVCALSWAASASAVSIPFFQPRDNSGRVGYLGLYNRSTSTATVTISAKDDKGTSAPGGNITVTLAAGAARVVSSSDVEQGISGNTGFSGSLGDGSGYWHLDVSSSSDVVVQNFISTTNGGLTEISTIAPSESSGEYIVHLFPAPNGASWAAKMRILNTTSASNAITVTATDVSGNALSGSASLVLGANAAVELTASDLATGSTTKGVIGSIATSVTVWRLKVKTTGTVTMFVVADTASGDIANVGGFTSAKSTTASGTSSTAGVACPYSQSYTISSISLTSTSSWTCSATTRIMTSNNLPNHTVGTFPNSNNPNAISAQNTTFTATLTPVNASSNQTPVVVGYALNGVKFDPATAGTCGSNISSTSQCDLAGATGTYKIEALGQSTFNFGVDTNNAHVQPGGAYHYHGMPEGLLTNAGISSSNTKMLLIGFALDGYPVYARYGYTTATSASSAIKVIKSSYVVDTVADSGRPSASLIPLGTFTSDWNYSAGSGDLDECNGRFGVTPDFPNGIYHYYATDTYPYLPRCLKGTYN